MKTYAHLTNGVVDEIITPHLDLSGNQYAIEACFPAEFVSQCVEITELQPQPGLAWTFNGQTFFAPVEPEPTPEQILATQSAKLQSLKQLAEAQKSALTARISTLNDAIELEMATPEEISELPLRQAQLLEWKRYAVYLGRVTGQAGWPPDVEWPVQPASGMDLTVSAVVPEVQ